MEEKQKVRMFGYDCYDDLQSTTRFAEEKKNSIIYSYQFWCLGTDSPLDLRFAPDLIPKPRYRVNLQNIKAEIMGRGVSSGGGQSSLNYLFGSGGEPKPTTVSTSNAEAPTLAPLVQVHGAATTEPSPKPAAAISPPDIAKQIPAGIQSSKLNNYIRADGQNTGNFLTDRPSTKVHAAPGGGSSLGYLFGGGSN
ncbi:hypothetical protein L6452_39458 [Arctium lappa]|uniref:Uncharacterized protein n=1 Tax=Arctium lappa TaxID=4217 RepID=A0ACB8XSD4_ARCLA|nr:hypothetical protein L6452_39458 [Arctium lappa]